MAWPRSPAKDSTVAVSCLPAPWRLKFFATPRCSMCIEPSVGCERMRPTGMKPASTCLPWHCARAFSWLQEKASPNFAAQVS